MSKPVLLIAGDGRVSSLRDVWTAMMPLEHWDTHWVWRNEASLDVTMAMLHDWKITHQDRQPKMIVLVSMLSDIIYKVKSTDGFTNLELSPKIDQDNAYPGLSHVQSKIFQTDREIQTMWPAIYVVWIKPYPVDVYRYVQTLTDNKNKIWSRDQSIILHMTSYRLAKYLESPKLTGSRSVMSTNKSVQWFMYWIKVDNTKSYANFMSGSDPSTVDQINPDGSNDGLHPSGQTSEKLINGIIIRANMIVVPPPKTVVPEYPSWFRSMTPIIDLRPTPSTSKRIKLFDTTRENSVGTSLGACFNIEPEIKEEVDNNTNIKRCILNKEVVNMVSYECGHTCEELEDFATLTDDRCPDCRPNYPDNGSQGDLYAQWLETNTIRVYREPNYE